MLLMYGLGRILWKKKTYCFREIILIFGLAGIIIAAMLLPAYLAKDGKLLLKYT